MQGQIRVKVGKKFRAAFPAEYRAVYGKKLLISFGFEKSLIATSQENWSSLFNKEIQGRSFLQEATRDIRRFFLGGVTDIEFDDQGRFVVPDYLRSYCGIVEDSEVVFVWQEEYVEIWTQRSWDLRQKDILRNIGAIAQALSEDGT
jgi:MraZ protein